MPMHEVQQGKKEASVTNICQQGVHSPFVISPVHVAVHCCTLPYIAVRDTDCTVAPLHQALHRCNAHNTSSSFCDVMWLCDTTSPPLPSHPLSHHVPTA